MLDFIRQPTHCSDELAGIPTRTFQLCNLFRSAVPLGFQCFGLILQRPQFLVQGQNSSNSIGRVAFVTQAGGHQILILPNVLHWKHKILLSRNYILELLLDLYQPIALVSGPHAYVIELKVSKKPARFKDPFYRA